MAIADSLPGSVQQLPSLTYTATIILPAVFIVYQITTCTYSFLQNLRAAQRSGIPYIITPWMGFDRKFLASEFLWYPIASRLPSFLTEPWLSVTRSDWSWRYRRAPFEAIGSDTVILVNYNKNMIYTCDADVITQITMRRNDFPKPIEIYEIMDMYGKNVVTVEGSEWRRHRKITGAQFNEKSNALVWKESLFQAQEMVRCWYQGIAAGERVVDQSKADNVDKPSVIYELSRDTMKLSLGVISRAGFGVRCLWPTARGQANEEIPEGSMSSTIVPKGHVMSYVQSLETLLHYVIAILMLPLWFLSKLIAIGPYSFDADSAVAEMAPIKVLNTVATAFLEWRQYMQEIYLTQVDAAKSGEASTNEDGLDLMGAMVRNSGVVPSAKTVKPGTGLVESEILGNSFVMFLAGHETAANSLHFASLFLACRPEIQRKLQADLDEILRDAPADPKDWDYETYMPKLFAGWAGAIMNEQLRLLPPVVNIPKSTSPHLPAQPIKVNGKDCLIGPDTFINLNTICVHRNPKYWPAGPPRDGAPVHPSNPKNDLDEFKPERWFVSTSDDKDGAAKQLAQDADKDTGVDLSPDTAASFFRPPKGAYIPFSEGFRACLGRRFAQVEILAALAVMFKDNSVELDVDEDEVVEKMPEDERTQQWHKARSEVERKINEESTTIITLQMRGAPIKLRVCKRGQELFD